MPRVIGCHAALLQCTPDACEAVKFQGAYDGCEQFPGIIVGESETIALTAARVVLLDCIGEAPNTVNNRHAAVTHSNQLTQAAGLETRRHQEHVAARVDALGEFGIEGEKNRYLLRIARGQVLKQLVVVLVTDAKDDKLHSLSKQWLRYLRVEESVGGNPGDLQDTQAKNTLVGEVMYCIHSGGIGKEGIVAEDGMHPVWYDTRVPIIAVDNIRCPIQRSHCFQRSAAKQDEPLSISGITVDILTIEVARCIDHIDWNAITNSTLPDSGLFAKAIHIHIYCIQHCAELEPVRIYLPIARHRQADIVTKHLERLWKRPYHISQSTHFDKRHDLGSKDEHSERSFILHEYCSCSSFLFRSIIARKTLLSVRDVRVSL